MNREELLKLVDSLNLPKSEYYILGGGSLVLFRNKRNNRRFRFMCFRRIVWIIKGKVQFERWR